MTRVLMTSWGAGTGGADSVVRTTASEMKRRGIGVDILDHHYEGPFVMHTYDDRREQFQHTGEVVQSLDWQNYDILHNHACTLSNREIESMRFQNPVMPNIYTVHSLILHEMLNSHDNAEYREWLDSQNLETRRKILEELFEESKRQGYIGTQTYNMEKADRIINMTSRGHELLEEYYPEISERGVVLPHGTDMHHFDGEKSEEIAHETRKTMGDGKILLYAGRMTREKGVYVLADAFADLKRFMPELKLLLIGETDPGETQRVIRRIPENYRSDVRSEGWKHDKVEIAGVYKSADLVAIPSYHESYCMTALEAMILGTPVAISDVDGPNDVWIRPMLAYGFNPWDKDSVVRRIEDVLRDDENRKRNAERVKEVVRRSYNIENVTDATLALYDHEVYEATERHILRDRHLDEYYRALRELSGDEKFSETAANEDFTKMGRNQGHGLGRKLLDGLNDLFDS